MLRVLGAIGLVPPSQQAEVAESLYDSGSWSDSHLLVSLFCLGSTHNRQLAQDYPSVPQVLWSDVLRFVFSRFRSYRLQKSRHDQWPESGKRLWDQTWEVKDAAEFVDSVKVAGSG